MNVTVIGADRPLGAALAAGLGPEFEVTAIGQTAAEACRAVDILERDVLDAALAGAGWSAIAVAHMGRVHDVAETVQAVRMAEALKRNK